MSPNNNSVVEDSSGTVSISEDVFSGRYVVDLDFLDWHLLLISFIIIF